MITPTLETRSGVPTKINGYALRFDVDTQTGPRRFERVDPSGIDLDSMDVIATIDHNDQSIVARRSAGNLALSIDQTGLRYSIDLDHENPRHAQLAADVRAGNYAGSSYEFVATGESEERNSAGYVRKINAMSVRQVGPVIYPANPQTSVNVRSLAKERLLEIIRLRKVMRNA